MSWFLLLVTVTVFVLALWKLSDLVQFVIDLCLYKRIRVFGYEKLNDGGSK